MLDIPLLRLQYEILNISLRQLSITCGVPEFLLEKEAQENNWTQYWPEFANVPAASPVTSIKETPKLLKQRPPEAPVSDTEGAESPSSTLDNMTLEVEQFTESARLRLRMYSLAKEILLASRYLAFEVSILDQAASIFAEKAEMLGPKDLRDLAAVYKEMTANSSSIQSMITKLGDDGIPAVILRNLAG